MKRMTILRKTICLLIAALIMEALPNFPGGRISLCLAETQEPLAVEVIVPRKMTVEEYTDITATVQSSRKADIGCQTAGMVSIFEVDEGDRVNQGDVMAELDKTDYLLNARLAELQSASAEIQVERAESEVGRAAINMETMKIDLERIREVVKKGSMPKQKLDYAVNAYEAALSAHQQAAAALVAARTQVKILKTQAEIVGKKLADCTLKAPFAGVVTRRHAEVGEWVVPGKPLLTLEADDPVELKGEVSARFLSRLSVGTPVRYGLDGLSPACPDADAAGCMASITEIAPVADPKRRTLEITVRLDNAEHELKPGLFTRLRILFARSADTLVIPKRCLLGDSESPAVLVVSEGRVQRVDVSTGIQEGEWIEIRSGLLPGQPVIYSGQRELSAGVRVDPHERKAL